MKKYYLAALALPLMFAACTQEDDVFEVVKSDAQQGTLKATFVIEEDATTRAAWEDNTMSFVPDDKFSLYWLGKAPYEETSAEDKADKNGFTFDSKSKLTGALQGYTNAVYGQETAGTFTSKSLIYAGKNIAVFPADLFHVSVKDIDIAIDKVQDASTVTEIPYISNVMDIANHNDGQGFNKPGYDVKVKMAVKQAANVFDMTINLANHDKLLGAPFNLAVEKVILKADADAFATEGKVVAKDAAPTNKGEVKYGKPEVTKETIVKQAEISAKASTKELVSKAITLNSDGSYTVRFVVLPTDVTGLTAASTIEVHTNCGVVTLKSANATYVKPDEGKQDTNGDVFANSKGEKFAIAQWFETIVTYAENADDANFKGEKVGKVLGRSITVDMKKADLSVLEVDSETKIMHYVNLYKNIGKSGDMQLNLKGNNFKLSAATVKAVNELHTAAQKQTPKASITLNTSANSITAIQLLTAGEIYDVARLSSAVKFILPVGEWSMNDNANLTRASAIENNGTLTIKGTENDDNKQNSFAYPLTNNGTLKVGGNDWLNIATTLTSTSTGTISIEAGKVLNFITGSETSNLAGTVDVKGQMTTEVKGVQLSGTVNNYKLIGATPEGSFKNNGVVNVLEGAMATYIADNTGSLTIKGQKVDARINLLKRSDEVVTDANKKGIIVYNWAATDGTDLQKNANDKFTHLVLTQSALTIKKDMSDVTLEFNGDCTLTSDTRKVSGVIVNSGKILTIISGNVLSANTVTNNGTIYLGGTIKTTGAALLGDGRLVTISGGYVTAI